MYSSHNTLMVVCCATQFVSVCQFTASLSFFDFGSPLLRAHSAQQRSTAVNKKRPIPNQVRLVASLWRRSAAPCVSSPV